MMEPISAIEVRLNNHEARLGSHHTEIGELRGTSASHETAIRVIQTELRETRDDVGECRREIAADAAARKRERELDREARDKERKEQREESAYTRKAFYTAASVMGGLMISVLALLASLLANG